MKNHLVPVILFCLVVPLVATWLFQSESHPKATRNNSAREMPVGYDTNATIPTADNDQLSNKQINYLIP
jgi:hypothetical protein